MPNEQRVFAILTVIPEADFAVRTFFNLTQRRSIRPRDYYFGDLPTGAESSVRVITSQCDARSNIPAAMAAAAFLQDWAPDYLLVVDIGGGVLRTSVPPPPPAEVVQLGDVVVHEKLIYYEFRKLTSRDELERSFPIENQGSSLWHAARQVQRNEPSAHWSGDVRAERAPSPTAAPKILFGEILCGEKLLGDPSSQLLADLLGGYDKAIAVDMESVGVARAIHDLKPRIQKLVEFIVIRGISDYCNVVPHADADNQATRERWRKYAAEAAAAVALHVIREEGEVQSPAETKLRYELALGTSLSTLKVPDHTFNLDVRGKDDDSQVYVDLLALVQSTGRAVLQGKAGAGKTAALNRLARSAQASGYLPVLLNLRKLAPSEVTQVLDPDGPGTGGAVSLEAQLQVLLSTSVAPISFPMLVNLPEGNRILFLVDGLNELFGETHINWLYSTLHSYADRTGASILITDRPANPTLPSEWKVAILHGVAVETLTDLVSKSGHADEVTDDETKLLKLPYYLNWAIERQDFRIGSAAAAHEDFLKNQLLLEDGEVGALAAAALDAYVTSRSPEFDLNRFRRLLGKEFVDRLTTAGVVQIVDSATAEFDHQLRHDYLAARDIAKHGENWNSQSFDALTFEASSFPTLDLVMDQLSSEPAGDEFIRAVYDWNWRAATRCASEGARHLPRRCSLEMEVAIACLIAEKQFDPVEHTRNSSVGSMRGFRGGAGKRIADLRAREEVWSFPDNITSDAEWFHSWREMFRGSADRDKLLASVRAQQSLAGWTAASVLRRTADPGLQGLLIAAYDEASKENAVRWRIVHVLGRFDTDDSVGLLLRSVASDADQWVRYGAGRSLVEIAATTGNSARRDRIIAGLTQLIHQLPDKVIEEIARTTLFSGARPGWSAAALPLVDTAQRQISTDIRKKKLSEVATSLRNMTGGSTQ